MIDDVGILLSKYAWSSIFIPFSAIIARSLMKSTTRSRGNHTVGVACSKESNFRRQRPMTSCQSTKKGGKKSTTARTTSYSIRMPQTYIWHFPGKSEMGAQFAIAVSRLSLQVISSFTRRLGGTLFGRGFKCQLLWLDLWAYYHRLRPDIPCLWSLPH